MKKKVNPRRKPVSAYDLQRAQDKATDAYLLISLYAMRDCGATEELMEQYKQKFMYTIDALNAGRLTVADLMRVLKDEYGEQIEL